MSNINYELTDEEIQALDEELENDLDAPAVPVPVSLNKAPLVVAYGMGVDSTAMLVGFQQRGIRPDLILFADTGSEKPETYQYLDTINRWLAQVGFPSLTLVKQVTVKPLRGPYQSLGEECIRDGKLPALAYGFKQCSVKWKVAPQRRFVKTWQPAIDAWAAGLKVVQAVGYDCSPKDAKRFAASSDKEDAKRYTNIYPLRDWGWDRDRCQREIQLAGLPVPVKSACYFCPSCKPSELHALPVHQLKAIVIIEARALPQIKVLGNGLWRSGNKGTKTGLPLPARMSDYIRDAGLLPEGEVARLQAATPADRDCDHQLLKDFLAREQVAA